MIEIPADQVCDRRDRRPVADSTEHFRGPMISVHSERIELPEGDGTALVTRDFVRHPGSVGVIALDDRDRVLLIRQYRHPAGMLFWEAPAGLRDVAGEPLVRTAQRELLEEAGFIAAEWATLLDVYPSAGMSDERVRVFLARGLTEAPVDESGRVLDETGAAFERVHEEADMPVAWVPLDEAVAKALRGEIRQQMLVTGVLAAHAVRAAGFTGLRDADAPEDVPGG